MDAEPQQFLLGEMKQQLEAGNMPLDSYLLLHLGARLNDAERELLLTWIDEEIDLLTGASFP